MDSATAIALIMERHNTEAKARPERSDHVPKMIQKHKGLFGETIYTDENFRMVGTSRKGLLGEEVFLDRDMHFAGTKSKGPLGTEIYMDQDLHVAGFSTKGPGNTRILTDQNGRYIGFAGKDPGDQETAFLNGGRNSREEKSPVGALIFLGVALVAIVLLMLLILK